MNPNGLVALAIGALVYVLMTWLGLSSMRDSAESHRPYERFDERLPAHEYLQLPVKHS